MRRAASSILVGLCCIVAVTLVTSHWPSGSLSTSIVPTHAASVATDHAVWPTSRPVVSSTGPSDRAVVALIAHGWNASGYEDVTTIKGRKMSMELTLKGLLQTLSARCSLHIYFIVGVPDEARIRQFLDGALGPASGAAVSYSFVMLDEPQLAAWLDEIGHKPTHRTGAAGNIKFFYPLMFPREDRMLMLDTDVLIAKDICLLWAEFGSFSKETMFGFVPQKPKVDPHADNEFNAGVALLHLGRMRQAGWISLARRAISYWHERGMRPACCAHGDQSVFHMIRYMRPEALRLLPRWWNINKCHKYQHIDRNPPGSFVGIVHLGCCKMCTRAKLWPRWVELLDRIDSFDVHHQRSSSRGGGPPQPLVQMATARCGGGRIVLSGQECPET